MHLAFFEDQHAHRFSPIALTRPVFDLVCGRYSQRERFLKTLSPQQWGGLVRDYLREMTLEENPQAEINNTLWLAKQPTLLINSRWIPSVEALFHLQSADVNEVGMVGETIVYLTLDPTEAILISDVNQIEETLLRIAQGKRQRHLTGALIQHPWDLVNLNGSQLEADFELSKIIDKQVPYSGKIELRGTRDRISIAHDVDIDPFVLLDARSGPITIDRGVRIQAFTRIEGPCHIGCDTQLFRANIRGGTTIGAVCRVGGEIEESIIHGYSNKYHDGFLGHSYVCPWVNLGALTTNSDLKNDYSAVRVPLTGIPIETETNKVGCFIGDHTKTALGSLFNTGSSIGVMSMILPGGELLPKYIPSFSRIWHGMLDDNIDLEASFVSAKIAMGRRGRDFTPTHQRLLRYLQQQTSEQRERAILRMVNRQVST